MGYRQALILVLAATAIAADSESEEVLKRAAKKVSENYSSIRSYTCMETIERDYYRPRAATLPRECPVLMKQRQNPTPDMILLLWSRDRLRLEVATSRLGEIQSWPGASRFSDEGIDALVREGPIGTGAFGTLLRVIFVEDVKNFGLAGETILEGRRRFVYTFAVPASESHYRVKAVDDSSWLTVGYEGVLYLDAETADPIQLKVVMNDLPLASGACQAGSSLTFSRTASSGQDILIPAVARQTFISPTGRETRNTMTFSNCRQYSVDSTVSYYSAFDDTPAGRRAMKPLEPGIPDLLPFSMELLTPLDSDTAAAGDRFVARLAAPLREGKRLIAPKGAIIEGRVSDVDLGFHPAKTVAFGLIPESLEIGGAKVPLVARLDFSPRIVAKELRRRKGLEFFLPPPGEYAHEFRFDGGHVVLRKGFVSEWLTAAPWQSRMITSADRRH